jgi:hypothetical protein
MSIKSIYSDQLEQDLEIYAEPDIIIKGSVKINGVVCSIIQSEQALLPQSLDELK